MKKFIPIVAIAALLTIGGLATSCGPSAPAESSSDTTSETTSDKTSESTDETVHVTGVTLKLGKAEIKVGETTTATVTVSPENATDASYEVKSSDTAVATVKDTTITAVGAGTTTIIVTTKDGAKTASATLTVIPAELPDPTITNPGESTFTVAAGADLTLPVMKATSGDGETDLSAKVQAEDFNDPASLSADLKTFNSKIAGEHIVSFFIVEGEGDAAKEASVDITINVTAAHADEFVVGEDEKDPAAIATYGTFKDGFAEGIDSKLYRSLNDGNRATHLDATDDGIAGNSLIIDLNRTAGSEANGVLINAFTDDMLRETPVTYEVEFDYKPLTESSFSDVFFGFRYDGYTGTNFNFIADKTVGKTSHAKIVFTEAQAPVAVNAGFFFFKLSGDSTPCKVAVDNFSFVAKRCAERTTVVPTSDELEAEGGFTFNWKERANTFGNGEIQLVENIENETIRNALTGEEGFGENIMHLTSSDSHLFGGLNNTNLVAGKKITISFKYYSVNDNGFHMILMTSAGNPTMDEGLSLTPIEGKAGLKQFVWTATLPAGVSQVNFYPTDPNFNIYMGDMNVSLTEPDPIPEDETALGHKVGDSWTNTARQWGTEQKPGCKVTNDVATPETVTGEGIGSTITKFAYNDDAAAGNVNVEWYQPGGKQIESTHTYDIEFVYFVESWNEGTTLMVNFDNNVFSRDHGFVLPMTPGYHKATWTWKANRNVDFFSLYVPGSEDASNGVFYLASTKVTLTKVQKTTTELGNKIGDNWTNTSRQWGGEQKAGCLVSAKIDTPETVTGEGIGAKIDKFEFNQDTPAGGANIEWYQPGGKQVEAGHDYKIEFIYFVESWNDGVKLMFNFDNAVFEPNAGFNMAPGYHKETVNWTANRNVDFFSIYATGGNANGSVVYVASTTVTLVGIN